MNIRRRFQLKAATVSLMIIAGTLFLGFILSALFRIALQGGRFGEQDLFRTRSRFAALAGIHRAISVLQEKPTWRAGWPNEEKLPQNPELGYKVKVLEDVLSEELGAESGKRVASGPNELYIFSQGFMESKPGLPLAAMGGIAYQPGAEFSESCFANSALSLSGGKTDAFDSRVGEHWYNPTESDPTKQTLVSLSSHVGGNQDIELRSSVTIDGDLVTPKPDTFSLAGTSYSSSSGLDIAGANILGKHETPDSPREIAEASPPYDEASVTSVVDSANFAFLPDSTEPLKPGELPAKVLLPGAYRSVHVPAGERLELRPGTYYFQETLFVDRATVFLVGSGHVRAFVGESLRVVEGMVNPSETDPSNLNHKPADLQFLFSDEQKDPKTEEYFSLMDLERSSVNAVVVGAKLRVRMSDTEYFGAIQADHILSDSCDFHYDLALQDLKIGRFSKWKLRGLTSLPPNTQL